MGRRLEPSKFERDSGPSGLERELQFLEGWHAGEKRKLVGAREGHRLGGKPEEVVIHGAIAVFVVERDQRVVAVRKVRKREHDASARCGPGDLARRRLEARSF